MLTIEEILAQLQAIIEGATNDDGSQRPLNDDEVQRAEVLEAQLAVARRDNEFRSRLNAYLTPIRSDLHINAGGQEDRRPNQQELAFRSYLRSGIPNQDLVYRSLSDDERTQYRAQAEGTGAAGGYLVPEGFRDRLTERLKKIGGITSDAELLPTSSGNPLPWPTNDDTANEGEIVAENAAAAGGADFVFGVKTLGAYKYVSTGVGGAPVKVPFELAQDAVFDLEGFVERNLARRIGRKQAAHWTGGTGVGQPQGARTGATTGIQIAVNANGMTLANIINATHVIDPEYRESGELVWVMHDTILAGIEGMVDSNGRPLLGSSSDGISDKPFQTLRGYRVVVDNTMPAAWAGAAKTVLFGNIKMGYVIRQVKEVTLIVLREKYAENGQIGYMAWARADGLVQDSNAYTAITAAV